MNAPDPARPRLRAISISPVMQGGKRYYAPRDPLQLCDDGILLPPALAAVLNYCDGAHDAQAIQAAIEDEHGYRLPIEAVLHVIAALDDGLLLANARAQAAESAALRRYRQAEHRPAACAGDTYPASQAELREALNAHVARAEVRPAPADARGIISPHIDYARGARVYAGAWAAGASAAQAAELVVILGTDHHGDDAFTLTRQHYATPYGVLPTAREVVDGLAEAIGPQAAYAGELRHAAEHSLELPLVWLHHVRHGRPVPVVPVLTGSFHRHMREQRGPRHDPCVGAFLDALAALTRGRRTLVIASGDLAHAGPAFDGDPLDQRGRAGLRKADQALLAHVCAGDAEAFYRDIAGVQNRNNVCGTAPIYLALRALGDARGETAGYDMCPADAAGESVVSVCGAVLL